MDQAKFVSWCSIGGDAENTSEECRGGGEGVEDPDNGVRGETEDGRSKHRINTHKYNSRNLKRVYDVSFWL